MMDKFKKLLAEIRSEDEPFRALCGWLIDPTVDDRDAALIILDRAESIFARSSPKRQAQLVRKLRAELSSKRKWDALDAKWASVIAKEAEYWAENFEKEWEAATANKINMEIEKAPRPPKPKIH